MIRAFFQEGIESRECVPAENRLRGDSWHSVWRSRGVWCVFLDGMCRVFEMLGNGKGSPSVDPIHHEAVINGAGVGLA